MKDKTSIIIAHRLQTVMHADQIIVLENWKVEAIWKHEDLLKKSKTYKTLVDLQNWKIIE
jgi:ABC-type multidrug transport system fused ATPase/permease subunit